MKFITSFFEMSESQCTLYDVIELCTSLTGEHKSHLALHSLINNPDDKFICNFECDIWSVDRLAALCAECVFDTLYL